MIYVDYHAKFQWNLLNVKKHNTSIRWPADDFTFKSHQKYSIVYNPTYNKPKCLPTSEIPT